MMSPFLDEFKAGNLIGVHVGDVSGGQDQRYCILSSQTGCLHIPRTPGKRESKSIIIMYYSILVYILIYTED